MSGLGLSDRTDDHPRWVLALDLPNQTCDACGATTDRLYRRWMEFDLHKMYCADCSVGQDASYEGD